MSEFDKISAEVQMRNLQPSVISARNAVELSKLQLLVLMNIEPETEIELQGSLNDYEESVFAGVLTADTNSLKSNSSLMQMDMPLQKNFLTENIRYTRQQVQRKQSS